VKNSGIVNLEKRKRVMRRSMALGHCICEPKRPCPCSIFKNQNICPCAGERVESAGFSEIKLTEWVRNAGCASKIAASDLERFLSALPSVDDPSIISGLSSGDDAGVYRIAKRTVLVQTVDVMTPCVDDPASFGKICAANSLSDVYAMGGVPRTALSVLGFPSETHDGRIMSLMLCGAMEVLKEAGCALLGGHSFKDEEIKLGFSVTGTVDQKRVVALETARPGDRLVLTKPLGTGILNFARQIGRLHPQGLREAEVSMSTLNKGASEAMIQTGVSACTDVTGFGLFGHLVRMARRSKVSARIFADALPVFPGVMGFLRDGVIPGAVERNGEFLGEDLCMGPGVSEESKFLGLDAQTSGGLLISVPKAKHRNLLCALQRKKVFSATIGEVCRGSSGRIELTVRNRAGESKTRFLSDEILADKEARRRSPCCCR
jgi:selenide,water dikinase